MFVLLELWGEKSGSFVYSRVFFRAGRKKMACRRKRFGGSFGLGLLLGLALLVSPLHEHGDVAGELAVVTGLIAVDVEDGGGAVGGEGVEGLGEAIPGGEGGVLFEVDVAGVDLGVGLLLEAGGFDVVEAVGAPAGGDHVFDEHAGDVVFGLEGGGDAGVEVGEGVEVFEIGEQRFGEESVAEAVAGGSAFAFWGFGAAGFCAVFAGGTFLGVGAHTR